MHQADQIRLYVYRNYICNQHSGDVVHIRAGDVHKDIGLQSRMPAVCSVLDGQKFLSEFNLELLKRSGPPQGANVFFTFKVLGNDSANLQPDTVARRSPATQANVPQSQIKPVNKISTNSGNSICFISCVGKKTSVSAAAKDLYRSDWFTKARSYVESKGFQWFILSAEYGLVHPDQTIAPYDKTLNTMGSNDRRDWAKKVLIQIDDTIPETKSFIFLAGRKYRENLLDPLKAKGSEIIIPMEGLGIGQQLSWLNRNV